MHNETKQTSPFKSDSNMRFCSLFLPSVARAKQHIFLIITINAGKHEAKTETFSAPFSVLRLKFQNFILAEDESMVKAIRVQFEYLPSFPPTGVLCSP